MTSPGAEVDGLDLAVVGVGHVELAVVVGDAERSAGAAPRWSSAGSLGHPPGAVAVAELEQPAADERVHRPVAVQRHPADGADLGVGDVEVLPSLARPLGWANFAASRGPSLISSGLVAGERGERVLRLQVQHPDLV